MDDIYYIGLYYEPVIIIIISTITSIIIMSSIMSSIAKISKIS